MAHYKRRARAAITTYRDEYRSLRGRPPSASGSRCVTSAVFLGLPPIIQPSHGSDESLLSSSYSNNPTVSAFEGDTALLGLTNRPSGRSVKAQVLSAFDHARRKSDESIDGIRRLINLFGRSILARLFVLRTDECLECFSESPPVAFKGRKRPARE